MKTKEERIAVSQLKAELLGIVDQISKTGAVFVVTKHGKPVARISPVTESLDAPSMGKLAGTVLSEEDIISPLGEDLWNAAK